MRARQRFLKQALLALLCVSPLGADDTFLRGHVTDSARRGIGDAIRILRGIFDVGNAPLTCKDAADVDDNGVLEVSDGIALLNFLFLGGGAPGEPLGLCGADPTEDALDCERFARCERQFLGVPLGGDSVFFVVDRSGSMSASGALNIAKQEIVRVLSELPPEAGFGVVFFDRGVLRFPSSGIAAAATPDVVASAAEFVQGAPFGAGSCIREGLLAGIELAKSSTTPRKTLVYFGDGGGTCSGEDESRHLARTLEDVTAANGGDVAIHMLGTLCPSPAQKDFILQLAVRNRGTFAEFRLEGSTCDF